MQGQEPRAPPARAKALIDFWFGPEDDPLRQRHRKIWFDADEEFDRALRAGFLADHERAARGELLSWQARAQASLALVLLLDQIPRNVFRGTPAAFATDGLARAAARDALRCGFDLEVPRAWRVFFYLPFGHSEDVADQRLALSLYAAFALNPDRPDPLFFARRHYEIIARFGRFPHRNAILGRQSTAQELAFLAEPHSSF
jgi:uncharacterized protein (DUF924 family)